MTRHEELTEEYIDAYFALLMEGVALEEGERLERENKELRQAPNAAVPEKMNQRCLQAIKRYFASQRRHGTLQTIKKIGYRAAVLIVVAGILFTTAFAFSESFRMMIRTFEDHISINLEKLGPVEQEDVLHDIEVNWLPDGCNFKEQNRNYHRICNRYKVANEQVVEVTVYINADLTMGLDSEDADVEQLEIQGNSALMITKGDDVQIAWLDSGSGSLWEVYGEGVPQSDMIRMAENVILK